MKRWLKKVEALGARMWLREQPDGEWLCVLMQPAPPEPIMRPYHVRALRRFRDDAIRDAIDAYDPPFRTYAEHYADWTRHWRTR